MPSALGTIKRHKLLIAVGIIVVAVIGVLVFYRPPAGETMVASGTLQIAAGWATDSFNYAGTSVNQSMEVGCNIPASMKIICQNLENAGTITVYINDESYATGNVAEAGEIMLSSGCGCSTVCICEIKIGANTIRITSDDFAGQLKYEIYVKSQGG